MIQVAGTTAISYSGQVFRASPSDGESNLFPGVVAMHHASNHHEETLSQEKLREAGRQKP